MSDEPKIDDVSPEVLGEWRVDHSVCMACGAPPVQAPELMGFGRKYEHGDVGGVQCYFKRQPATPGEVERACRAASVSCCSAVQYHGSDKRVSERIKRLGSSGIPRSAKEKLVLAFVVLGLVAASILWLSTH